MKNHLYGVRRLTPTIARFLPVNALATGFCKPAGRLKAVLLGLFLTFLLGGCGARFYVKKAERLDRRALKAQAIAVILGAKLDIHAQYRDTLVTFTVPSSRVDTVLQILNRIDTVENERVRVIVQTDTLLRTIRVKGECKEQTIVRTVHVPYKVYREYSVPKRANTWLWVAIGEFLIIAGGVYLLVIKKT